MITWSQPSPSTELSLCLAQGCADVQWRNCSVAAARRKSMQELRLLATSTCLQESQTPLGSVWQLQQHRGAQGHGILEYQYPCSELGDPGSLVILSYWHVAAGWHALRPQARLPQACVRGALLMLEWFYLGEITLAGAYPYLSVYILKLLGLCPKSTEISGSLSIYSTELWSGCVPTQKGDLHTHCHLPTPFLPASPARASHLPPPLPTDTITT